MPLPRIPRRSLPQPAGASHHAHRAPTFSPVAGRGGQFRARTVRLEFLTRLYFARLLKPEKATHIYAAQEREVATAIRRLRLLLSEVPEGQTVNRMSLDLRLRQMELVRTWLQEVREEFHMKQEVKK